MPDAPPRRATLAQDRSAERHRALVDAALTLIERRGRDAVTLRAVAREAGVPVAATSYYFAGKAELLDAAMTRLIERETERLGDLRDAFDGSSPLTLEQGIDRLVEIERGQLAAGRLTQIAQFEDLLSRARAPDPTGAPWTAAYLEVSEAILARLGSRNPQLDARIVVATVNGLLLEGLTAGGADFPDRVLRPVLERVLGLLLDPGASR